MDRIDILMTKDKPGVKMWMHTERADFSECPLSSRTAKEALRARQPSSLHTPSHFSMWPVGPTGNYREMKSFSVFFKEYFYQLNLKSLTFDLEV